MLKEWLTRHRNAIEAFVILMAGFLVLLAASLFLASIYFYRTHFELNRPEFENEIIKIVRITRAIPSDKLQNHLHFLASRDVLLQLQMSPQPNTQIFNSDDQTSIRSFAQQHYDDMNASISLPKGHWLIIQHVLPEHAWFYMGFSASITILFFALLLICYWAVKRLSLPTRAFLLAARRFGVDMQSPPMAVEGTKEVRELIQAFNEMQERVRRLMYDRTQMLAAISHDLRTPITRLQLRAEYLKDTEQYEKAVADLDEMERMISSILSFARDYSTTEAMEPFDLNALLEAICHDMEDRKYKADFNPSQERIVIWGRLVAIKRAFTNLIENAIKYGNEVEVFVSTNDRYLTVKINDKGPGVPEYEMENVFAPFYRIDRARSPEKSGTGLGLAVARDIIRAHGGDIKLHNLSPNGLSVVVTLPLG